MSRLLLGALRAAPRLITLAPKPAPLLSPSLHPQISLTSIATSRNFTQILQQPQTTSGLLNNPVVVKISNSVITRNLIKFSMRKGKRKTVKAVLKKFYRLNWGIWIRTKCGRKKKLWKKSSARRRRLRQHVMCSATQSYKLDKMVGAHWRKPRYYVDDPYEPYHEREYFQLSAKKPRPFVPPETGTN